MPNVSNRERTESGSVKTFRCADVADPNCRWEVSGKNEAEIMPQIERHGREQHNISNFDENTRNRVRNAIRTREAA